MHEIELLNSLHRSSNKICTTCTIFIRLYFSVCVMDIWWIKGMKISVFIKSILVWHWRAASVCELGNFEDPKTGPECPGYRGAQVSNIAMLWVWGQAGGSDGCTLWLFESCLMKAMLRLWWSKVGLRRDLHALWLFLPRSFSREIWAHFCWVHQGPLWDGIRLYSSWDLAVLPEQKIAKSWFFLPLCIYLLMKTFQMNANFLSYPCGMCLSLCVCMLECVCVHTCEQFT